MSRSCLIDPRYEFELPSDALYAGGITAERSGVLAFRVRLV